MSSPVRKAGATKARRLRERHGIAPDVALPDVLDLAERQVGVSVLIFEHLGDDLAGAYLPRGDERLVLLNGSDAPVRLRFTLAHELCHHCFGDDAQPDTHAGLARPGHWIEVRANAFAGELLVPGPAVARWVEKRRVERADLYDVVALALQFGVSAMVAFYRLCDAGVPMDRDAVRADVEAGRHLPIFELGEPYEDSLLEAVEDLPRIPDRYRNSLMFRAALGDLPVAEAARRLGFSEPQLRDALAPLGLLPPA